MSWISIHERLPSSGQNPYGYTITQIWGWDGEEVFICEWGEIDCGLDSRYLLTRGFWFSYIDGTECRSAYDKVTHWMPIEFPEPPEEK